MRVLVVRVTALGDVVLTAPLARAIAAASPGVELDLLTEARLVPLLEASGAYRRVIGWDRRGEDAGLGGLLRVRARLDGPYDLVIDLQNKLRTRALTALLSARVLRLRKRSALGALRALLGWDRPLSDRHSVELYGDVARRALPALPAPEASRWGLSRARTRRLVGLGVGTAHATKRWPAEHFAALAAALAEARPGARFVLVGGPSDRAELDALTAAMPPELLDPRDVIGLDPAGLLERLAELELMVSTDSGAAHLTQALGVPTVVLFGPTAPGRWGPRDPAHAALTLALDCAPCSNTGGPRCPRADRAHACMRELGPERVLPLALERLA